MNMALPSLDARRAEAAEYFRAKGVPHRRMEEWKYSDLRGALGDARIEDEGSASWRIDVLPGGVELFDLSNANAPEWVTRNLGTSRNGAMESASFAYAKRGVALRVTHSASEPVRLQHSGQGHLRVLIVLEKGASLTLIETQTAAEFRNIGAEFVLEEGATLDHIRLAPNVGEAVQVETIMATLAKGATYHAHFANFDAKLSRANVYVRLAGEGAQANLSGVSVLSSGHADVTTRVEHAVGNTHSTQLFKCVAGGKSRAVYQGKITVAEGANGSDSRQTAKGLLLEDRAEIDLKPELEIFADDVKCAHGAAVGDLDSESLFYLRARGIPEREARALLMRAFLEDAVAQIEREDIRAEIWHAVESSLAEASAA